MLKIILSVIVAVLFNMSAFAGQHKGFGVVAPDAPPVGKKHVSHPARATPATEAPSSNKNLTNDQAQALVEKHKKLLDAIAKVESGGEKNPDAAVGDNGEALGRFQIHKEYWDDAFKHAAVKHHFYKDGAKIKIEAELCVVCYWHNYPKAVSDKALALCHHYGGSCMPGTEKFIQDRDGYWPKVEKAMKDAK